MSKDEDEKWGITRRAFLASSAVGAVSSVPKIGFAQNQNREFIQLKISPKYRGNVLTSITISLYDRRSGKPIKSVDFDPRSFGAGFEIETVSSDEEKRPYTEEEFPLQFFKHKPKKGPAFSYIKLLNFGPGMRESKFGFIKLDKKARKTNPVIEIRGVEFLNHREASARPGLKTRDIFYRFEFFTVKREDPDWAPKRKEDAKFKFDWHVKFSTNFWDSPKYKRLRSPLNFPRADETGVPLLEFLCGETGLGLNLSNKWTVPTLTSVFGTQVDVNTDCFAELIYAPFYDEDPNTGRRDQDKPRWFWKLRQTTNTQISEPLVVSFFKNSGKKYLVSVDKSVELHMGWKLNLQKPESLEFQILSRIESEAAEDQETFDVTFENVSYNPSKNTKLDISSQSGTKGQFTTYLDTGYFEFQLSGTFNIEVYSSKSLSSPAGANKKRAKQIADLTFAANHKSADDPERKSLKFSVQEQAPEDGTRSDRFWQLKFDGPIQPQQLSSGPSLDDDYKGVGNVSIPREIGRLPSLFSPKFGPIVTTYKIKYDDNKNLCTETELDCLELSAEFDHKSISKWILSGRAYDLPVKFIDDQNSPTNAIQSNLLVKEPDDTKLAFCFKDTYPENMLQADNLFALIPLDDQGELFVNLDAFQLDTRRASDLLALDFRFADMALVGATPAALKIKPLSDTPKLLAELPPQHMAEQAYLRREKTGIELPNLNFLAIAQEIDEKQVQPAEGNKEDLIQKNVPLIRKFLKEAISEDRQVRAESRCKLLEFIKTWPEKLRKISHTERAKEVEFFLDFSYSFYVKANVRSYSAWMKRHILADARLKIAKDQRFYIGPDYLDPDALKLAWALIEYKEKEAPKRDLLRRLLSVDGWERSIQVSNEGTHLSLGILRELAPGGIRDLIEKIDNEETYAPMPESRKEFQAEIDKLSLGDGTRATDDQLIKVQNQLIPSKDRRAADYAAFRDYWRYHVLSLQREQDSENKTDISEFISVHWALANGDIAGSTLFNQILEDYTLASGAKLDPYGETSRARWSGRSRLVFAWHPPEAANYADKSEDAPFELSSLMAWNQWAQIVPKRAGKLVDTDGNGEDRQQRIIDDAEILQDKGINPSKTGTSATRMAEVYASSSMEPSEFETAIEIPFRLQLAPAQDSVWVQRHPVPDELYSISTEENDIPSRQVIWSVSLAPNSPNPSLRAVWSDDFRPESLLKDSAKKFGITSSFDKTQAHYLNSAYDVPPRGPLAPWLLKQVTRVDGEIIVPDPDDLKITDFKSERYFRASMDAYDRDVLVKLTSVYGLPIVVGRDGKTTSINKGADAIEPPSGYELQDVKTDEIDDPETKGKIKKDLSAIYRPKPLDFDELTLTALGGTLNLDTQFQPPVGALLFDNTRPFPTMTLERWRHRAVQGRDIKVELVYKGYLFPFGNRAALVKVTERKFVDIDENDDVKRGPTAYLHQRFFIRVAQPTKTIWLDQPNGGRSWPCDELQILTVETPDIIDPLIGRPNIQPGSVPNHLENPSGRVSLGEDGVGLVFWPRTAPFKGAEIKFEFQIDGSAQNISMPLMFVDAEAANDPNTLAHLIRYYNDNPDDELGMKSESSVKDKFIFANSVNTAHRRVIEHNGVLRQYAAQIEDGDTSYETLAWVIGAEGRSGEPSEKSDKAGETLEARQNAIGAPNENFVFSNLLAAEDQPPFYPFVQFAQIRLDRIARLFGQRRGQTCIAAFDATYIKNGLPSADEIEAKSLEGPEIFLDILSSINLDSASKGDRIGAIGRPAGCLVSLARKQGPLTIPTNDTTAKENRSFENNIDIIVPDYAGTVFKIPSALERKKTDNVDEQVGALRSRYGDDLPPNVSFEITGSTGNDSIKKLLDLLLGDTKLFGVFKLSEIIYLTVTALSENVPQINEAISYADGAIGDASDFALQIKNEVVGNLSLALENLERNFNSIEIETGKFAGRDLEISKIYVGVGASLKNLRSAVNKVRQEDDPAAILAAAGKIPPAAKALVRELDKVARDPISPIKRELFSLFNDEITEVEKLRDQVEELINKINDVAAFKDILKDIESELIDGIINAVTQGPLEKNNGRQLILDMLLGAKADTSERFNAHEHLQFLAHDNVSEVFVRKDNGDVIDPLILHEAIVASVDKIVVQIAEHLRADTFRGVFELIEALPGSQTLQEIIDNSIKKPPAGENAVSLASFLTDAALNPEIQNNPDVVRAKSYFNAVESIYSIITNRESIKQDFEEASRTLLGEAKETFKAETNAAYSRLIRELVGVELSELKQSAKKIDDNLDIVKSDGRIENRIKAGFEILTEADTLFFKGKYKTDTQIKLEKLKRGSREDLERYRNLLAKSAEMTLVSFETVVQGASSWADRLGKALQPETADDGTINESLISLETLTSEEGENLLTKLEDFISEGYFTKSAEELFEHVVKLLGHLFEKSTPEEQDWTNWKKYEVPNPKELHLPIDVDGFNKVYKPLAAYLKCVFEISKLRFQIETSSTDAESNIQKELSNLSEEIAVIAYPLIEAVIRISKTINTAILDVKNLESKINAGWIVSKNQVEKSISDIKVAATSLQENQLQKLAEKLFKQLEELPKNFPEAEAKRLIKSYPALFEEILNPVNDTLSSFGNLQPYFVRKYENILASASSQLRDEARKQVAQAQAELAECNQELIKTVLDEIETHIKDTGDEISAAISEIDASSFNSRALELSNEVNSASKKFNILILKAEREIDQVRQKIEYFDPILDALSDIAKRINETSPRLQREFSQTKDKLSEDLSKASIEYKAAVDGDVSLTKRIDASKKYFAEVSQHVSQFDLSKNLGSQFKLLQKDANGRWSQGLDAQRLTLIASMEKLKARAEDYFLTTVREKAMGVVFEEGRVFPLVSVYQSAREYIYKYKNDNDPPGGVFPKLSKDDPDYGKSVQLIESLVGALGVVSADFTAQHLVLAISDTSIGADQIATDKKKIIEEFKGPDGKKENGPKDLFYDQLLELTKLNGKDDSKKWRALDKLKQQLSSRNAKLAPLQIIDNFDNIVSNISELDISNIFDAESVKRVILEEIKKIVPTKQTTSLTYSTPVSDFRDIFVPEGGTGSFNLNSKMTIDLRDSVEDGQLDVDGEAEAILSPFSIKLLGGFDAITLKFSAAKMAWSSKAGSSFDLEFLDYEIGKELEFIEELAASLSLSYGGAYVKLSTSFLGIEAGYRLNIPGINLGGATFMNVGLGASAILPFEDREAIFQASLSSRNSPFMIIVGIWGGGGHFALQSNGRRIVGFDSSFVFGGGGALNYGVLELQGRISVGVFLRKAGDFTEVSGDFFAGGTGRVAIFSISSCLTVRTGMDKSGSMSGSAVFSYSFSIGFAKAKFDITLYKKEAKGFSNSGSQTASLQGGRSFDIASTEQPRVDADANEKFKPWKHSAIIEVDAVRQDQDYEQWQSYFADDEFLELIGWQ